jgi:hypothetical protein
MMTKSRKLLKQELAFSHRILSEFCDPSSTARLIYHPA